MNLIFVLIFAAYQGNFPCGDETWWKFEDEKCYKILGFLVNVGEAEALCAQEFTTFEQVPSTLANIHTSREQDFLRQKIYEEEKIVDNIWIGGKRMNQIQFQWTHGSLFVFTNWDEFSPSSNEEKACVQMSSHLSLKEKYDNYSDSQGMMDIEDGQWTDASCAKKTLVLCEKTQTWSFSQLQKALIDLRANPFSIGFIYVQLAYQPDPIVQWPLSKWEDVTEKYSGLFFRAAGGSAAPFGEIQESTSPRLNGVQFSHTDSNGNEPLIYDIQVPLGQWSGFIPCQDAHSQTSTNQDVEFLRFLVNNFENKPIDSAVKIWMRI